MKQLIKEYQTVLITSIASLFVFICFYTIVPQVVSSADKNKIVNSQLDIIKENNNYSLKLEYPKGNYIRLIKGVVFDISEYMLINDNENGLVSNYNYELYINGKRATSFSTNECGGYQLNIEVIYKNKKIYGELLIIVEER